MEPSEDAILQRYAGLIESMLRTTPRRPRKVESDRAAPVVWGLVLPLTLVGDAEAAADYSQSLVRFWEQCEPGHVVAADAGGHARPAYRPLLIASWARAVSIAQSNRAVGEDELRSLGDACRRMETIVDRFQFAGDSIPATAGAAAGEAAFAALALHVAGTVLSENAWRAKAVGFMTAVASRQQPGGALLSAGRSDNPETLWFHELVLLHALSVFACDTNDAALVGSSDRAAEYHQNDTQPDHATNQPWGIAAFLLNPSTRPLADGVLHAARVKSTGSVDGVSLMLLADCLYCLRSLLGLPLVSAARR